jgi:acetyl-CoA carboxylase biotin carboxyl carrier protein
LDVDAKLLKSLVEIMERDGLDRLRVRFGDVDLDLRMSLGQTTSHVAPARIPADDRAEATPKPSAAATAPANVQRVLAPLVGVFYRAPAPGVKPFVELGDSVSEGQVLCILEAMKLMNEIVSEHDGKIVKICVADGELVSLHQELFWIER